MKMFAQLRKASGHTQDRSANIVSAVSVLLKASCPNAILGRVGAVVVDSFKRLSFWPMTHIGKESRELLPTGTNSNAPFPIVSKRFVFWVETSLPHRFPNAVNRTKSICAMAVAFLLAFQRAIYRRGFLRHGIDYRNVMFSGGPGANRDRCDSLSFFTAIQQFFPKGY